MLLLHSNSSQMTLRPCGHLYDVPRVDYALTLNGLLLYILCIFKDQYYYSSYYIIIVALRLNVMVCLFACSHLFMNAVNELQGSCNHCI